MTLFKTAADLFNGIYSDERMPRFIPGTSGHALPKPDVRIATHVLRGTEILAPWEMHIARSDVHFHVVMSMEAERLKFRPETGPRPDQFLNDEVLTTYAPKRTLRAGDDPRADYLFSMYGEDALVFEVEKVMPVVVHGQVAKAIKFRTNESKAGGAANVEARSFIVESPFGGTRAYFNTEKKFAQLYGEVIPGPIPKETMEQVKSRIRAWADHGFIVNI